MFFIFHLQSIFIREKEFRAGLQNRLILQSPVAKTQRIFVKYIIFRKNAGICAFFY